MLMVAAAFFQVLNRDIFHLPIGWTEELARYSMIWMALLGTQAGLREGKQMSVEFVTKHFPAWLQRFVYAFDDFLCFAFSLLSACFSIGLLQMQLQMHQKSAAMGIPMFYVYAILTFSFTVMACSSIVSTIRVIRFGVPKQIQSDDIEEGF